MRSMDSYSKTAMERAMKIQEVILRAMAKKITWWQAAEILGFSDRHLRRIRERYEEFGYESMFDKRRGQPSPKRVPFATSSEGDTIIKFRQNGFRQTHCSRTRLLLLGFGYLE